MNENINNDNENYSVTDNNLVLNNQNIENNCENNCDVNEQNNVINTNSQLNNINNQNNQQGVMSERIEIKYERNELVMLMAGSKSESNKNNEKTRSSQYSLVDTDDPDLFDGAIKCAKLKCILFGIITLILNTIRLFYLIFLHLGYPAVICGVRCFCAFGCFFCILCGEKEKVIDPETNCIAFYKCFVNFVKCPCWIYAFITDCFYDIKNRALDNARNGCYKFIHYDCGFYEKVIEDPFNNYMKKRSIILTTDPDDSAVIYGDACKDNTIF